jgi:SOS-response transcriptional repressor LexA
MSEYQVIDYIILPKEWNIKADFVIKTTGESMVEHGIFPNMLCFIRKQPEAIHGHIVALNIYEHEQNNLILKKVKYTNGVIEFQNGKGDKMEPRENMEVIGIVTFWMEDYRKGS